MMETQTSAPPTFTPGMTIGEAQVTLRQVLDVGHKCPVCTQLAKVYKRKLNSGMARSLIAMYQAARLDWQHIPTTIGALSREEGKLRYWGLIEEETERRPDGGRSGYWRVTELGEQFVLGKITLPSHARIYDGRLLGLTGRNQSIRVALGAKFSYEELMSS